jgi:hypothetical protein
MTMRKSAHIIFDIESIKDKKAKGRLLILNDEGGYSSYPCVSGPWGKGYLPLGNYSLDKCYFMKDDGTVDAFKREDKPWVAKLTPLFETDRTGLLIHPDGNVPGSLGCAAITDRDMTAQSEIEELLKKHERLICKVT